MTMGYYDTKQLPIYEYLHAQDGAALRRPDHFFQAAFGGSFLNHQYLVAAAAPPFPTGTALRARRERLPERELPAVPHDRRRRRSGDPGLRPADHGRRAGLRRLRGQHGPAVLPADERVRRQDARWSTTPRPPLTIGDRLSDAGVSWAGTRAAGTTRPATSAVAATRTAPGRRAATPTPSRRRSTGRATAATPTARTSPSSPTTSRSTTSPATRRPARARAPQGRAGLPRGPPSRTLPKVSFIKPLGNENEHPGYASEPNGSDHLVDLIKAIRTARGQEHADRRDVRRVRRPVGPRLAARLGPPGRARPVRARHPRPGALIGTGPDQDVASTTPSTTRRRSWRRSRSDSACGPSPRATRPSTTSAGR